MNVVGAALLVLVVYTYAGYPILIATLARFAGRKSETDREWTPTVSVLCSVYNGATYIEDKFRSLAAQGYPADKLELIFYDDGSSDDSAEVLEAVCAGRARSVVIRGQTRRGKPAGLMAMAERASGDVLLLTDVRQPLNKGAARELVAALSDPSVGCAGGMLELSGASGAGAYWKYERWIRSSESSFRSVVGVSGSIYAIAKADFPEVPLQTILDDLYVPMSVLTSGRGRVVLVPEAKAFDVAADDGREFQRKARTLAGNFALFRELPSVLSPLRNPIWFETVSHKLLRLVCPWALLALIPISCIAAADSRFFLGLAACQGAAYAAAAAGPIAGPIGRLARTFVVMNAAAIVGLWRFLRGRQSVTW